MPLNEYVTVEVSGYTVDKWRRYSLDSDLRTPADAFSMAISVPTEPYPESKDRLKLMRDILEEGASVKVYIGADREDSERAKTLQLWGIIDTKETDRRHSVGTVIEIQGRDRAAHIVDSDVPMDYTKTSTTFIDVVRAAVEPWDISVVTDGTAARDILTGKTKESKRSALDITEAKAFGIPESKFSRSLARKAEKAGVPLDTMLGVEPSARSRRAMSNNMVAGDIERITIQEAKPQVGETVWSFLSRHASRLKLFMWFSPDGKLIVGSPNYSQQPMHQIVRRIREDRNEPNTILAGGERRNAADRLSEVKVYGKTRGNDVTRSKFIGFATDPDLPFHRLRVVHDNNVRSVEDADALANKILAQQNVGAQELNYTLRGHGTGKYLYAIDTMMNVYDEVPGINGRFYCVQRRFINGGRGGAQTQVTLIPPDVLVP